MSTPDTKPVSMIELFYDLVFVYMLSQATGLLHHLHAGVVPAAALAMFAFVIVVFVNSWMIQSVFINRYGEGSWFDIGWSFLDMMIVLYMANAFGAGAAGSLRPFFFAAALLSLSLWLQYLKVRLTAPQAADRRIARLFLWIVGGRAVALLLAAVLPPLPGILVALIGVIASWVAPSFTGFTTRQHPIIFSHLLERLTLLTIITFGETIVGIAGFFSEARFGVSAILIFVVVAMLFMVYITEFDHLIDPHRQGETGNLLIYLHYPILFGLLMMTIAVELVTDADASHAFAVNFLFIGLLLFNFGIWLSQRYNQARYQAAPRTNWAYVAVTLVAWAGCLLVSTPLVTLAVAALVTTVGAIILQRVRLSSSV